MSFCLTQSVQAVRFNEDLCWAIDDTIVQLVGHTVLDTVYVILRVKYDVRRDELPYRLDTLSQLLGNTFPVSMAGVIGIRIALKFYTRLGLTFHEHEGYTLLDYVQEAKFELARVTSNPRLISFRTRRRALTEK